MALVAALLVAAQPALGWRVTSTPVWSSPYPGEPWTFSMRVNNTGNSSLLVTGFKVWTNWGDPPTEAQPQHTSTALPVEVPLGATGLFRFTINVPNSAAGHTYHLDAVLTGANSNGSSGWTTPAPGAFGGWNFTVLSSSTATPGNAGNQNMTQSPIFWVGLGLIGASAAVLVLRAMRSRKSRSGGRAT